jgi:capsid assembly protease
VKILDVLTSPWAIVPDKLIEIQNIYATHLRGEKIDLKAVEAKIGRPLMSERRDYENQNGVGIVRIDGVLARRANLFMQISGGTSTELALSQFRAALHDREAASILLVIDSPGGTVDGTQELAETIYASRGQKPISAVALGTIASAAYWIGAAADQLYLASDTTVVGSIGVVATHVDVSQAERNLGIKTTEIAAGRYKRIASPYAPLTQEGRASMQDMVDQIYTAFVHDVATFRGRSVEQVLSDMADGRIFLGAKALDAGLADGFAQEQDVLVALQQGRTRGIGKRSAGSAGRQQEERRMNAEQIIQGLTVESLTSGNPALAAELARTSYATGMETGLVQGRDEGYKAGYESGFAKGSDEGRKAGAEAERQRIKDIESNALPGHAALVESMKWDGQTTGPQAAIKILQAEKETRGIHLQQLKQDVLAPVTQPATSTGTEVNPDAISSDAKKKAREQKIEAHMSEHKTDYRTAAFAVSRAHPDLFKDR